MYANNIGGKAMKKIICRREYDTGHGNLSKNTPRVSSRSRGFEESLYQTEKGLFFFFM